MKSALIKSLPIVVLLGVIALLIWFVLTFTSNLVSSLLGDWRQIVVAATAAAIMAIVGISLTVGNGQLSEAGQYEKISVWAALMLSVVSAITTSLGLLLLLQYNTSTGSILIVAMSLALGIGIQLSMLVYALRIGQGLQRLSPLRAAQHPDGEDLEEDLETSGVPVSSIWLLMLLIILCFMGISFLVGRTVPDLYDTLRIGLGLDPSQQDGNPWPVFVLAPLFLLPALVLARRLSLLPQPATLGGLVLSIGIYGVLLMFSSGFGYMSYFRSAQSDEVLATDRDSVIANDTVALVSQIRQASFDDVKDAFVRVTEGGAFQDLSREINELATLFVQNESLLQQQIAAHQAKIEQQKQARLDAQTSVNDAEIALREAELQVDLAKTAAVQAEQNQTFRRQTLDADLQKALKDRDDAAAGRDGTGQAICGPICRGHERRANDIQNDIDALAQAVTDARADVARAEAAVRTAQLTLDNAKRLDDGTTFDDEEPPSVVDRSSFLLPRDQYRAEPSIENLHAIAETCGVAANFLLSIQVPPEDIPLCETAAVEAELLRYQEIEKASKTMVAPCTRDEDTFAQATDASATQVSTLDEVPEHLRLRLAWMSNCLEAANTGTDRMNDLAVQVSRLRSEYTNPGYDSRRVLRSLFEGNLFALFAVLMALVVDTAILFAGFVANAYRAQSLTLNPNEISPDLALEGIDQALKSVSKERPHLAAQKMSVLWKPIPTDDPEAKEYSRRLMLAGLTFEEQKLLQIILDAAGPTLVRYVEHNGEAYWLLHKRLVQMINKKATADVEDISATLANFQSPVATGPVTAPASGPSYIPLFTNTSAPGAGTPGGSAPGGEPAPSDEAQKRTYYGPEAE